MAIVYRIRSKRTRRAWRGSYTSISKARAIRAALNRNSTHRAWEIISIGRRRGQVA